MPKPMDQAATIKSDETLFEIMETLKESGGAGVTDLANETDLAKSTVHKHLATMKSNGFVLQDRGEYRLSYKFLDYGITLRNSSNLFLNAKSKIDDLAEELDERVYLIIEEQGMAIVLYVKPDEARPTNYARMGHQKYLHQTSGGKAMLANFDQDSVDSIVEQHGLPEATENTITERKALDKELEKIRNQGFALNEEESIQGLSGIGGAVIGPNDDVRGAISVGVLAHRMREHDLKDDVLEKLLHTINAIEIDLAFS